MLLVSPKPVKPAPLKIRRLQMKRIPIMAFLFAWLPLHTASAITPSHCPGDDIVIIPGGKGVQITGRRPRDEVVVFSLEYDRGDGWRSDSATFQWDPREPGNDPAMKPYPVQTPGAFGPISGSNGKQLQIRVLARSRSGNSELCPVDAGKTQPDASGVVMFNVVAKPGEPPAAFLVFTPSP
jgi:hypothetical protein